MSYLFDTSFLSHLLDHRRDKHQLARAFLLEIDKNKYKFISVVAMAELCYGINMSMKLGHDNLQTLTDIVSQSKRYPWLEITQHTGNEYAKLKSLVAMKYMPNKIRNLRKKKGFHGWPEEWVDEITGKNLGIQENDLWQCAQAVERGLSFVTTDKKMMRICDASDGNLNMVVI